MSAQTIELSALLSSVSTHLDTHPDLVPVNVIYPNSLQLRECIHSGEALLAWADTLTEPSLEVVRIDERAFVHVHGWLDNHPIVIWEVVAGLAAAIGPDAFPETGLAAVWITVENLRAWITEGTIPVPGERPEGAPELAGIVS